VMRGNRDFLIGERFCAEARALLLDDPAIVTIGATRVLLSHGDGLCVDDHAYQRLRALVRDEQIWRAFSRLPLEARRRLAVEARAGSREHLAGAAAYITDVNASAVAALMRDSGVALLVHGHTHRPAIHRVESGEIAGTRIVLGAWHDDAMVLRWDNAGPALVPCPS
jgi:UDP-2,3-diacylglucosamine hydrolase